MNTGDMLPCSNHPLLCRRLLFAANHAARQHLLTSEREDCALAFCEQMLARSADLQRLVQGELLNAWLYRCADHFARNHRRHLSVVQMHECAWPAQTDDEGESETWDIADSALAPSAALCRYEFDERLTPFLDRLTERQRRYLLLRHAHGQSYAAIATRHNENADAVRKTVHRAAERIKVLLGEAGFDAAEANDYLREMSNRNTVPAQGSATVRHAPAN